MFDLSGRVAAVTGGNRGIGRGIALGLAQAGASVAVLARSEENNRAVVEELRKLGVAAAALSLCVGQRARLPPPFPEGRRILRPLDLLCHNARLAIRQR